MNKNWKDVSTKSDRKKGIAVYADKKGDIHVRYPKAPKWAQRVAMDIWRDMEEGGPVTRKGTRDIVRGMWAYMIATASR